MAKKLLTPLLLLILLSPKTLMAQINDNFSDGDFTSNPSWSGDESLFQVESEQLRSNSLGEATYYLSTPSTLALSAQWEFFFDLQFDPSGVNFVDVYLIADNADLNNVQNGYFLRIGDTDDKLVLNEVVSGTVAEIITSPDDIINSSSSNPFRVRVSRDENNLWTLAFDDGDTGNFTTLPPVTNNSITTSTHFGVFIEQSSAVSPQRNHFFDDFNVFEIVPDTDPPAITNVAVIDEDSLVITFSEPLDETTAETFTNYTVNNGIGNPSSALLNALQPNQVGLKFATLFTDQLENEISIINVEDLSGNAIPAGTPQTATFTFLAPFVPDYRDIVINEIMADPPASVQGGVPNVEYLELFNNSGQAIELDGWFVQGASASGQSFPSFVLEDQAFVILTAEGNETLFAGVDAITWGGSSSATLTNGGENLVLIDPMGVRVDSVEYSSAQDGISFELVNPNDPCQSGFGGFLPSINANGGTPGTQNSVFDPAPDTESPTISNLEVSNPNQVTLIYSEAMDTSSIQTETNYTAEGLTVSSVSLISVQSVTITFDSNIPSGVIFTLELTGISDCSGNALEETSIDFGIGREPEVDELVISEIMADPTPVVSSLPEVEYLEIYNRSTDILQLQNLQLQDGNGTTSLPSALILPNNYLILTAENEAGSFQSFGDVLAVSGFPGLTNSGEQLSLARSDGNIIFSVNYATSWYDSADRSEGGYSLEIIDPDNVCGEDDNWTASLSSNGGTPGLVNSVDAPNTDVTPPVVASVNVVSDNQLRLVYGEKMDTLSIQNPGNYTVNGLTVSSVEQQNDREVIITFGELIPQSELLSLNLSNIQDCSGNPLNVTSVNFGIGREPQENELIISEIMADPSPVVSFLPEAEYIEVFNRTEDFIELQGLILQDGGGSTELPAALLLPGSYLVLTNEDDAAQFNTFGLVVGVEGFPGLTNSGEQLSLARPDGNIIFSVNYATNWYDSAARSEGGYSLEIVDPDNVCGEDDNWTASLSPEGGTPGQVNSVDGPNLDNTPPEIASLNVEETNQLRILFNERMDTSSIQNPANYTVEGLSLATIELENEREVILIFNDSIPGSQLLTLNLSDIFDCSGNVLATSMANFGIGESPGFNEILITEIMAIPSPAVGSIPEEEYVELYNPTNKILELAGVLFTDLTTAAELPSRLLLPGEYLIVTSQSVEEDFIPFGQVLGVSSFPSLNNTFDVLTLTSATGELIFNIAYQDDWFNDPVLDDGGVALEMVDTTKPCLGDQNWNGSVNTNGGTPGTVNSINGNIDDNAPPFIEQSSIIDESRLLLFFSEKVLQESAENMANYTILEGGNQVASVSLQQPSQNEVVIELNNPIGQETFSLRVANISDCQNNLSASDTVRFGRGRAPDFLDLIITEIQFDPTAPADALVFPNGELPEEEFLEIYNTSDDVIELEELLLVDNSDTTTFSNFQLFPQEYLILSSTGNAGGFSNFGPSLGITSFPSLSNEENLSIIRPDGEVVFHIAYKADWLDDIEKVQGGFTLEMVDIANPCGQNNNWTASISPSGGTPGETNSVNQANPDNFGPTLNRALAVDEDEIKVFINEKVRNSSVLDATYQISDNIQFQSVRITEPTLDALVITTTGVFETRRTYTLEIENLSDCIGNLISEEQSQNQITFALPEPAEEGDIQISEILFNPKEDVETNDADFVEIYNNSPRNINLKDWILADSLGQDEQAIFEEDFVLPAFDFLVFTAFPEVVTRQYPMGDPSKFLEVENMPSLPNDEGSVAIIDNQRRQLDFFAYEDNFHSEIIRNEDGVALERISFDVPTNMPTNWTSAVQSENFGTPGKRNSQAFSLPDSEATIRLDKDDDGIEDKVFDPRSGEEIRINYNFPEPGNVISVNIFNTQGRLVKTLTENQTVGTEGFLEPWDGFGDDGQLVRVGYYVILVEIFNLNGNTDSLKETVVVGSRI